MAIYDPHNKLRICVNKSHRSIQLTNCAICEDQHFYEVTTNSTTYTVRLVSHKLHKVMSQTQVLHTVSLNMRL